MRLRYLLEWDDTSGDLFDQCDPSSFHTHQFTRISVPDRDLLPERVLISRNIDYWMLPCFSEIIRFLWAPQISMSYRTSGQVWRASWVVSRAWDVGRGRGRCPCWREREGDRRWAREWEWEDRCEGAVEGIWKGGTVGYCVSSSRALSRQSEMWESRRNEESFGRP